MSSGTKNTAGQRTRWNLANIAVGIPPRESPQAPKPPDTLSKRAQSSPGNSNKAWIAAVLVGVVITVVVVVIAGSGSSGPSGDTTASDTRTGTTSGGISGSFGDWVEAVCEKGMYFSGTRTRDAIGGGACTPRNPGGTYINFDQFDSEFLMENALRLHRAQYSARAVVGDTYLAIWTPGSRNGSELAPLETFGFSVVREPIS